MISAMQNEFKSLFGDFLVFNPQSVAFENDRYVYRINYLGGNFRYVRSDKDDYLVIMSDDVMYFNEDVRKIFIWLHDKMKILGEQVENEDVIEDNDTDDDSEISEEEEIRDELIEISTKLNELLTSKMQKKFKEQNFQIKKLHNFQYAESVNNCNGFTDSVLNIEFDYGLEKIVLHIHSNDDKIESLNDFFSVYIDKTEKHTFKFKSLQKYVPASKMADFEEIFRWILRNDPNFCGCCELIFEENFSLTKNFFQRVKSILEQKITPIDLECIPNCAGESSIFFSLEFPGVQYSCYFSISTDCFSVSGLIRTPDGKILQQPNVDDYIPMDGRKLVIEIIEMCMILVNYRGKLTFDIERETTEFEKKLSSEHSICLEGDQIHYCHEKNNRYSIYKLGDKPRNRQEREFLQKLKS